MFWDERCEMIKYYWNRISLWLGMVDGDPNVESIHLPIFLSYFWSILYWRVRRVNNWWRLLSPHSDFVSAKQQDFVTFRNVPINIFGLKPQIFFWETSIYLIWSHHDHCCISPNVTFKILIQFLTRVDWVQWSEKIYKMFKQILSPSDLPASSLLQWQYNNIKSTVVRTILRWSVHGARHKIKCFSRCCHCSGSCLTTKDFQHD